MTIDDNGKSVVICDDCCVMRGLIASILNIKGYSTFGIEDGKQLINYLTVSPAPSMITIDFNMPEINGYQAIRYIKKINENIPIVMITSQKIQKNVRNYLEKNNVLLLDKPISVNLLEFALEYFDI